MSRAINIRDIDPSKLGPNSPLLALMRRAPRRDIEHQEQVRVFEWALDNETRYPDLRWLFAVPNFAGRLGRKTAKQGARLKAEGRKPGVPDMILPVARRHYRGFVIELKAGKNRPTKEQEEWLAHFVSQNWLAIVVYSADSAISALTAYLDATT